MRDLENFRYSNAFVNGNNNAPVTGVPVMIYTIPSFVNIGYISTPELTPESNMSFTSSWFATTGSSVGTIGISLENMFAEHLQANMESLERITKKRRADTQVNLEPINLNSDFEGEVLDTNLASPSALTNSHTTRVVRARLNDSQPSNQQNR